MSSQIIFIFIVMNALKVIQVFDHKNIRKNNHTD